MCEEPSVLASPMREGGEPAGRKGQSPRKVFSKLLWKLELSALSCGIDLQGNCVVSPKGLSISPWGDSSGKTCR